MYFLLSEEDEEVVLACCDRLIPVSGLEICNILSISAVLDLKKGAMLLIDPFLFFFFF